MELIFLNRVFSMIAIVLCAAGVGLWLYRRLKSRFGGEAPAFAKKPERKFERAGVALEAFLVKYHMWLVLGLMVVAVAVRLWQFPGIPPGLNQDEASIGYDTFAIGNYGIDRNGDPYPVYPIAFGDGHGPLYTYLSIPAVKLFGLSVFSVRLTNVLLGCISVFVFYMLVKRVAGKNTGLLALALMATCPTAIISSRWSLDANPLPSVFIMAVYLFVVASEKQKTWLYALSSAVFGLTVYAYGPAGVVTPLFLLLSCFYLIRHKKLKWSQFLAGIAAFLVVFAPLGLFLAINAFDLPAIQLSWITFPKFTVARTSTVMIPLDGDYLKNLAVNVRRFFELVVLQPQDFIYNMVPGFGTTYLFTAPLIILGAVVTPVSLFRRRKREMTVQVPPSQKDVHALPEKRARRYDPRVFMLIWFAAASVLCLLIKANVNRIGIIYPAVVFLIVMAVRFLYRQAKALACVACLLTAVCFVLFAGAYFTTYSHAFGSAFFYSFGDAMEDAMQKTDGVIYVTEREQNEPYILALFYSGLPPRAFADTVIYHDDQAEWRWAKSFDRFRFGTPRKKDPTAVYVIDPSEESQFDPALFKFDRFAYYTVAYPSG